MTSRDETGPGRRPGWTSARRWAEVAMVAALAVMLAAPGVADDLRRPFSGDELFTYYGSMASGPAELYELLTSGGFDASPPLYFVAVWQAQRVFANPQLAVRIPTTIGFVVMCVCLYAFVRRRGPAPYAVVAMVTPAVAGALGSASNGRPYGMMLGLAGIALLAWQAAAEGRRRPLALAALAASLAAGVATHYYAVLLLVPLGLAELTRTIASRRGRPDLPIWAALACTLAPLPWLRPMMAHSRELARGASWLKLDRYDLMTTYTLCLPPLLPVLAAFAVLLLARPWIDRARPAPGAGDAPAAPPYPPGEVALILGLFALPIIAYVLGSFVTKAYNARYVATFVAGFSLLLSYLGLGLFRGRVAPGLVLVAATLWCVKGSVRGAFAAPPPERAWLEGVRGATSRAAGAGRKVLIPEGGEYIRYCYYLDPADADRLTLVDLGDAMHENIFRGLQRWVTRKGLAHYDIKTRDDYYRHLGDYYFYGQLDDLVGDRPPFPLKFEPLGPGPGKLAQVGLYAVEPAAGGR